MAKAAKPPHRPKPRPKSVDLGALQDAYSKAKSSYNADMRALTRAQEAADLSKRAYQEAHEALKAATHSVLA